MNWIPNILHHVKVGPSAFQRVVKGATAAKSSMSSEKVVLPILYMSASSFLPVIASALIVCIGVGWYIAMKVTSKFRDKKAVYFKPAKLLSSADYYLCEILQSCPNTSYCVSDPDRPDCPVIYCSSAFEKLTGYTRSEVCGRNCRFLQGPETSANDTKVIREAIDRKEETICNLVNYRKDGTTFSNSFFLCPLHSRDGKVAYYVGIQTVEASDAAYFTDKLGGRRYSVKA